MLRYFFIVSVLIISCQDEGVVTAEETSLSNYSSEECEFSDEVSQIAQEWLDIVIVDNLIYERLLQIDDHSLRQEYVCFLSNLEGGLSAIANRDELTTYLLDQLPDDSEMVSYLMTSVDKGVELYDAIASENNSADASLVTCYLEDQVDYLLVQNDVLESRTCPSVCAAERELCYTQKANAGMGAFAAGATTAGGILSYGWYTGVPAGIGAAGAFLSGTIGGIVITGVGWYNCDLAYDFCCMNGGGANNQPLTKKCP
jgi:hypothetical protein